MSNSICNFYANKICLNFKLKRKIVVQDIAHILRDQSCRNGTKYSQCDWHILYYIICLIDWLIDWLVFNKQFSCIVARTNFINQLMKIIRNKIYLWIQYYKSVLALYCVVFLFCFSSSCIPYVVSFSGLSILDCPFGIL